MNWIVRTHTASRRNSTMVTKVTISNLLRPLCRTNRQSCLLLIAARCPMFTLEGHALQVHNNSSNSQTGLMLKMTRPLS